MPGAALLSRQSNRRGVRISLRRRLRAGFRALLAFAAEIFATPGYRHREDFMQLAAREARERSDAIEASVGAMSAADIRRVVPQAPAERRSPR